MSTVAKYYFEDYDSYTAAVKRMCSEVGDNGSWDCNRPYIWIYDSCDYVALAGKVCQAHGGEACN